MPCTSPFRLRLHQRQLVVAFDVFRREEAREHRADREEQHQTYNDQRTTRAA